MRNSLVLACVVGLAVVATVLARPRSSAPPTITITRAPARETASTKAVFRFRTRATRTWCRRDRLRFRRCRGGKTYTRLRPGRHAFTVKTHYRGRTVLARYRWRVRARRSVAAGRLVFEDTFDGTTLNTSEWAPYDSPGHAGRGLRRPSAFSLDGDGNLVVTARMVDGQIVSGGMALGRDYTYGRFEFRVRTEPDPTGTMSGVVLTWPESGRWPVDGENDIYETGSDPGTRSPFFTFVHYGETNEQHLYRHEADASRWHTMAMDWTRSAIRIYRDGELVWTLTDPAAIPHVAHHLCIQLDPTATRTLTAPVRMLVDYVRIYQ
ncbi:MAG: glycoside hydrolase family 16 protein [Actinomycetota bacterium]|nr:glycoside hydrolase family 16 protein [Actinomycetota bacterium]